MPSVASESANLPPARPAQPTARSFADDNTPPSTPFGDLLDSTAAQDNSAPSPAPPQPRADQPRDTRNADAGSDAQGPSRDRTRSDDAKASDRSSDDKTNKADHPTTAAKGTAKGPAKKSKDGDTKTPDAEIKAADTKASDSTSADPSAALKPAIVAPAPVATVIAVAQAQPADDGNAEPQTGAKKADAVAALQATAQPVAAKDAGNAAAKPGAKSGAEPGAEPGQDDAPTKAGPTAKDAKAANSQITAPDTNAAKDGTAHDSGDKPSSDTHHAAADLIAKIEGASQAVAAADTQGNTKAQADAAQTASATVPGTAGPVAATQASVAPNVPSALQPQAAAVPLAGLAIEITTQANAGKNRFEIRLDPPELGRIDVKLDVDRDGNVSTTLVAHRQDTLDLLKRDQSTLERALQDSGLKTSDSGLQFSLHQQNNNATADDTPAQSARQLTVLDDDPAPLETMRQGYGRLLGLGGGLDIRV